MDLIAAKELHYAGRTVWPGEAFNATDRDGKLLVRLGKARISDGRSNPTDLPKQAHEDDGADERPALRAELKELTGRTAYNGWDADELRTRILTAKREAGKSGGDPRSGEYGRRDMRATE